MNLRRILRAVQRQLTNNFRDRRTLPTWVVVPLTLTLLIGWVLRSSNDAIIVGVVSEGDHWALEDLAGYVEESLDSDGVRTRAVASRLEAQQALEDGELDGFVVVDQQLADAVLNGTEHRLALGLRGDDFGVSDKIRDATERAFLIAPLQALRKATEGPRVDAAESVDIQKSYVFTDDRYEIFDHLAPALLSFIVFLTVFSASLVSMSRERALHTIERLLATPLRRWEILAGPVVGYLMISIVQAIIITVAAVVVLNVQHYRSITEIVAVSAVISLAGSAIGLFISGFTRSQSEAMQLLPLVLVPQSVLCGVIFPISTLPEALQQVSRLLPLTYGVDALRDLMLRDRALFDPAVLTDLGVLVLFAAAFLVLAVRELKPVAE